MLRGRSRKRTVTCSRIFHGWPNLALQNVILLSNISPLRKKPPTNLEMRDIHIFFLTRFGVFEKFWTPMKINFLNKKSWKFNWFRWFAPIHLGHFRSHGGNEGGFFGLFKRNLTQGLATYPQNHGTIIVRVRFDLSIAGGLGQCWLCATVTRHLSGDLLEVLGNLIGTQRNLKVFTFTTDIFGVWNFQTLIFPLFLGSHGYKWSTRNREPTTDRWGYSHESHNN